MRILETFNCRIVVFLFEEFDTLETPLVVGATLTYKLAFLKDGAETLGELVWVLDLLLGHHIYNAHAFPVALYGFPPVGDIIVYNQASLSPRQRDV